MEHKSPIKSASKSTTPNASQQLFMATVISLTWQLLIVVLLPSIGGHFLDAKHHSTPLWTLLGLLAALLLAAAVTYRAYQNLKSATAGGDNV